MSTKVYLKIDPELRDFLESTSDQSTEELTGILRENGGPDRPIEVWKEEGYIVDGHRRYEICNRLDLPFAVKEMSFEDKNQVRDYMVRNQLANRNLSDFARAELLAMRAETLKKEGKPHVKALEESTGMSRSSIKRDIKLAKQAESLTPDWKEALRTNTLKIPKRLYKYIAEMKPAAQDKLLQDCVKSGDPLEILADRLGRKTRPEYKERKAKREEAAKDEEVIKHIPREVPVPEPIKALEEPVIAKPTKEGALAHIEKVKENYVKFAISLDKLFSDEGVGAKWKSTGAKRKIDKGLRDISITLEDIEKGVRKR